MEPMRLNHATVKQFKDANGIIIVTCNRCEVTRVDLALDLIHNHEIPVWQCASVASVADEACLAGSMRRGFTAEVCTRRQAIELLRWGSADQKLAALDFLESRSVSATAIHVLRKYLHAENADMIDLVKSFLR